MMDGWPFGPNGFLVCRHGAPRTAISWLCTQHYLDAGHFDQLLSLSICLCLYPFCFVLTEMCHCLTLAKSTTFRPDLSFRRRKKKEDVRDLNVLLVKFYPGEVNELPIHTVSGKV